MLARSNQAKLWGLILPGREHSKCKGPGVRRSLACLRNEKVSVAWAQGVRGRGKAGSQRGAGAISCRAIHAVVRCLDFGLIAMGKQWRILNKK